MLNIVSQEPLQPGIDPENDKSQGEVSGVAVPPIDRLVIRMIGHSLRSGSNLNNASAMRRELMRSRQKQSNGHNALLVLWKSRSH